MTTTTLNTARRSPSEVPGEVVARLGMKVLVHGRIEAAFLCPHRNPALGVWVIHLDHNGDPELGRYPARAIDAVRGGGA